MKRIAFTLFLGLLAACGAGFGALAARGRLLPLEVAPATLQFEFLAIGALFLMWGILQLALDGREEKPRPDAVPPRRIESEASIASILEARGRRLNGKNGQANGRTQGDRAIAPPDSNWN